jgi:hypothetical protein
VSPIKRPRMKALPATNLALERFWDSTITGGNQELQLNSLES